MKYTLFLFIFFILVSCSKDEGEKPLLSKCTMTISEGASFVLCSHFREPIDTINIDNKVTLNGIVERYGDSNLLLFKISGLNQKFKNDIILDDLEIKIIDEKLNWIEASNVNSSIFFESYNLIKNNENKYILVINGKDLIQGELFAYSSNKFSMQLNMTLTFKIQ